MAKVATEIAWQNDTWLSFQKTCQDLENTRHALGESEEAFFKLTETMEVQTSRHVELKEINSTQRHEIEDQRLASEELLQSLKREKLIKHVIQLMNRTFDVKIILEMVSREIGAFLGADRCLVAYYQDEDTEKPVLAAQYCSSEAIHPVPEESKLTLLLKNKPDKDPAIILLNEWVSYPSVNNDAQDFFKAHHIQSYLMMEIRYRETSFGRLSLHQCSFLRVWTREEQELLEIVASHIGAALYQAKLYTQAQTAQMEAEKANRQKTKILSYVSHDLKTPLAAILRLAETLETDRSEALSETQRQIVDGISEGAQQLHSMIGALLDKARIENGQMVPLFETIEPKAFLAKLTPLFNSLVAEKDIRFSIDVAPDLTSLKTDPTHLQQILINLFSNAVKYNRPDGMIFLKLYKSGDGQHVIIEVRDTGIGISPEKLSQIFTEYFRVDLSKSGLIEGDGLGLAFVKKLVELHHGSITVESEQNTGSTFKVCLPLDVKV